MQTHRFPLGVILGWLLTGMLGLTACEAVPGASTLEIIGHNGYIGVDITGRYGHVVGEVQNNGNTALEYVWIEATFYDQNGIEQSTSEGFALLHIMLPGEISPFRIQSHVSSETSTYLLNVVDWDETDKQPCRGLEVLDQTGEIDDLMNWYHVFGTFENVGAVDANGAQVVATCYDQTGEVVGVGWDTVSLLEPGEAASFDVVVFPADSATKIATCTLLVQCESLNP
jgi:hypothetical protein